MQTVVEATPAPIMPHLVQGAVTTPSTHPFFKPVSEVAMLHYGKQTLYVYIGEITVEKATDMLLNHNTHNRPKKPSHIRMLANIISACQFLMNGETIILDYNNDNMNGQHRFEGVVTSGKSIDSLIVEGVDPSVFPTIDQTQSRTLRDVLVVEGKQSGHDIDAGFKGKKPSSILSSAIRNLDADMHGGNYGGQRKQELFIDAKSFPGLEQFIVEKMTNTDYTYLPVEAQVWMVVYYIGNILDKEKTDSFFNDLLYGGEVKSPAKAFNNYCNGLKKGRKLRHVSRLQLKAMLKALYWHMEGITEVENNPKAGKQHGLKVYSVKETEAWPRAKGQQWWEKMGLKPRRIAESGE